MEIGEKYTHKYNPAITIEITGYTNKGYEVLQNEGKKKLTRQYYNQIDFDSKKGIWIMQESPKGTLSESQLKKLAFKYRTRSIVQIQELEEVSGFEIVENDRDVYGKKYNEWHDASFDLDDSILAFPTKKGTIKYGLDADADNYFASFTTEKYYEEFLGKNYQSFQFNTMDKAKKKAYELLKLVK